MNPGGEPERDDFGLPPVDIEIPDDARELDRDVQAYRREQRAQRRHLRRRRLRGPLTGDGMVMPLLAGCLIFALIAAVLLTVFAATGDVSPRSAASGRVPAGSARSKAAPSTIGPARAKSPGAEVVRQLPGQLPDKSIEVSGRKVRLRKLPASALAMVPPQCACTLALQQLIMQAAQYKVLLYLVAGDREIAVLQAIAARHSAVLVADDHRNVLASTYRATGLAVILVHADGSLALAQGLQPGLQLRGELQGLGQSSGPATAPGA